MSVFDISPIESKVNEVLGLDKKKVVKPELFEKILESIATVEENQIQAKNEMADVLLGNSDNSHGALIALQKTELQMQFLSTVSNKITQGVNTLLNAQI